MMMTARVVILLLACVVGAYASSLPLGVEQGFFPGRSGNVIVDRTGSPSTASVTFIDPSGSLLARRTSQIATPSFVSVPHVADIIGRTLGMSPFHPEYNTPFLTTDLFHIPHANVLISVVGLSRDDISSLNLPQLNSILHATPSALTFKIVDDTIPYSPLTSSVSISTATTPSVHGIVAPSWIGSNGMRMEAFLNPTSATAAEVANLATVLSQALKGQSRVFSASSNPQYAMAHCVHAKVLSRMDAEDAKRISCIAMDEQGSFTNMVGSNDFVLGAAPIFTAFESTSSFGSMPVSFANRKFTVEGVEFDLSVPEYYSFFAELHYLLGVVERATADRTGHPHFHALTISSLEGVLLRDTAASQTFATAAKLVDAVVPELIRRFSGRYVEAEGENQVSRCVVELLLLPAAAVPNNVVPNIHRRLAPVFERYHMSMPTLQDASMRVTADHATMRSLCDELNKAAQTDGYQVYCPLEAKSSQQSMLELHSTAHLKGHAATATNSTSVRPVRVQRYQIILWLSLLLAFAIIFTVYAIAFQDSKKDTLLYSKFNPNWGKKQH